MSLWQDNKIWAKPGWFCWTGSTCKLHLKEVCVIWKSLASCVNLLSWLDSFQTFESTPTCLKLNSNHLSGYFMIGVIRSYISLFYTIYFLRVKCVHTRKYRSCSKLENLWLQEVKQLQIDLQNKQKSVKSLQKYFIFIFSF